MQSLHYQPSMHRIHDRCVAWAMRICYGHDGLATVAMGGYHGNNRHHHRQQSGGGGGGFVSMVTGRPPPRRSRGEAGVLVRESTCTVQTYKTTRAILGNFYSYNDFLCNSVNKWLYQFIPVR